MGRKQANFRIKGEPQSCEEVIFRVACSLACKLAEGIFKEMDDELKEEKALGIEVVGFKEKWVISVFGDIKQGRRLYRTKRVITTLPQREAGQRSWMI
jgi:hypothetical protein